MHCKAVLFDLDGTLLNTLEDLCDSTNHALASMGFPGRTLEEVQTFVGNGVGQLIVRAVPPGTPPADMEQCLSIFRRHYAANCRNKTAPYPGIPALLQALHDAGIHIGVISNKFDTAVRQLCAFYFGTLVEVAVGESPDTARKPAPDAVLKAVDVLGLKRADVIYVGDSDVDILTAKNAGIPCISVTWGFRSRTFLQAAGAAVLADRPADIPNLL